MNRFRDKAPLETGLVGVSKCDARSTRNPLGVGKIPNSNRSRLNQEL